MNELIISYDGTKVKKMVKVVVGFYFTAFASYFFITELLAKQYGILFICSAIGIALGIGLLLANTVVGSKPLISINNTAIASNLPAQSVTIQWVNVTEMNIGVSYLLFVLNGRKQQKLDLSDLKYKDMKDVKSKAMEICEFKNIPYKND